MNQSSTSGAPDWEECVEILQHMPGMAVPQRMEAIERLVRNPSPAIRQRALRMGAALLPDERIEACLREEADDVMRNAGVEILKLKGCAAYDIALSLVQDKDPDVVLQAILILDHIGDPRACHSLRPLLQRDDPNVVQAALTAMGHLGDARAIPDLLPFLSGDPWLQIAAVQALGDLRSPRAIRPLALLLADLFLGTMAAEALARIGGPRALRLLSDHWLAFRAGLNSEHFVGLLAHVAQGIRRRMRVPSGLLPSLEEVADSGSPAAKREAAACLLALGPSPGDLPALEILASGDSPAVDLPGCLKRRSDLIPVLLPAGGPLRDWGFQLAARFPTAATPGALARALAAHDAMHQPIQHLAEAARRAKGTGFAGALLDLFATLPAEEKASLAPALSAHKGEVMDLLSAGRMADPEEALLIGALVGAPAAQIAAGIRRLPSEARLRLIPQVSGRIAIMRRLPWPKWVESAPGEYVPLLADVAPQCQMREAVVLLRPFLRDSPSPPVVRAVGKMGDRESTSLLAALLSHSHPILRACALESLGSIGGPDARAALQRAAGEMHPKEARLAYHALSQCSAEEDAPFFRRAAADMDWMIRMSCTDALGHFPSPENLAVLMGLAADPVAAVAQKAQSFLDT